jgi:hypothetical protein
VSLLLRTPPLFPSGEPLVLLPQDRSFASFVGLSNKQRTALPVIPLPVFLLRARAELKRPPR